MVRRRSRKPKITGSNPVRACRLGLLCWGDFLGVGTTPPEGSPAVCNSPIPRSDPRSPLPLDQLFSPVRLQTLLPPSQFGWRGRDTDRLGPGTSSSLGAWCSGGGGGGLWAGWGCKLQCPRGHLESVSPSRRPNALLARRSATKRFLHPEVPSVLRRAPCRCRTPGPRPQSAEGNPLRLPHQGERKPCASVRPAVQWGRSSRQGQASGAPHLFASHHRPLGGMDGDFAMTSTDPQELACCRG